MFTIFRQTIYIFIILICMTLLAAGVFFVFVKSSENKNRELMVEIFNTSTIKNIETEPIVKNEPILATTTEKIKEITTTTPEEKISTTTPKKEEVKTATTTAVVVNSKDKVLWDVPFTSQAPYGGWSDPRQEAGCEEASILMAAHWITGKALTPAIALKEILAMSEFELEKYGNYYDTSAVDTLKLFKEYFGYQNAYVEYDISLADIKKALKDNNVVSVPVNGIKLGNPYFTLPGPPVHQLLIIGYDDVKGEFITNDPGTRHGAGYRYKYATMMAALGDYPTGHNEKSNNHIPAMIVISQDQK